MSRPPTPLAILMPLVGTQLKCEFLSVNARLACIAVNKLKVGSCIMKMIESRNSMKIKSCFSRVASNSHPNRQGMRLTFQANCGLLRSRSGRCHAMPPPPLPLPVRSTRLTVVLIKFLLPSDQATDNRRRKGLDGVRAFEILEYGLGLGT